jgi:hypothetical protein
VQGLREEIHPEKMTEDWILEEILQHQDFPLTLWNMEKIRDLRILLESSQNELTKLENKPTGNEDLILQERIILEGTRKEIQGLERKAFYWELEG